MTKKFTISNSVSGTDMETQSIISTLRIVKRQKWSLSGMRDVGFRAVIGIGDDVQDICHGDTIEDTAKTARRILSALIDAAKRDALMAEQGYDE